MFDPPMSWGAAALSVLAIILLFRAWHVARLEVLTEANRQLSAINAGLVKRIDDMEAERVEYRLEWHQRADESNQLLQAWTVRALEAEKRADILEAELHKEPK
jgi:hypothetical protein